MGGMRTLKTYIVDPTRRVVAHARNNPISATLYAVSGTALASGLGTGIRLIVDYDLEKVALALSELLLSVSAYSLGEQLSHNERSGLEKEVKSRVGDMREWMGDWGAWESYGGEFPFHHPLRHCDENPTCWEAARIAARELNREQDFYAVVREYRSKNGTRFLADPSVVKKTVGDGRLENILLAA